MQLYVQAINWQVLENKAINQFVICAGTTLDVFRSLQCYEPIVNNLVLYYGIK